MQGGPFMLEKTSTDAPLTIESVNGPPTSNSLRLTCECEMDLANSATCCLPYSTRAQVSASEPILHGSVNGSSQFLCTSLLTVSRRHVHVSAIAQ